jgi:hypothetical protein
MSERMESSPRTANFELAALPLLVFYLGIASNLQIPLSGSPAALASSREWKDPDLL